MGKLFERKKQNKAITQNDINELRAELTLVKKTPKIAAALKELPQEIEICDESPDEEGSKSKISAFNFGGFKGKKFESDNIDMGEGISFKMPKKFKTMFESKPCDLTAERDKGRKERLKKANEELKEREKAAKEAQRAENERFEREAKEKAYQERVKLAEEKEQRKKEKATMNKMERERSKKKKRNKEEEERIKKQKQEAERIAKEKERYERERQEKLKKDKKKYEE